MTTDRDVIEQLARDWNAETPLALKDEQMMDEITPEYALLMEAIEDAESLHEEAKQAEREARRVETQRANELIAARKAFVDYLIANKPVLCDEISKRQRSGYDLKAEKSTMQKMHSAQCKSESRR